MFMICEMLVGVVNRDRWLVIFDSSFEIIVLLMCFGVSKVLVMVCWFL